jgi:hypothetical protein
MIPAWKPELVLPKCIADAITAEFEGIDFGIETLRKG